MTERHVAKPRASVKQKQKPRKEIPSTWTAVKAGEVRLMRTLKGDVGENQGVYLVLNLLPEDYENEESWCCVTLVPYHWAETSGEIIMHNEQWLQEWTEPLG